MGGTKEIWIAATALSTVLAAQADAQSSGKRSGVAALVRGSATGSLLGAKPVRINVGDNVFRNQRIATGARSHVQVMMLDRSTITLGPNSELTVDEFRYDRASKSGRMAIDKVKGLFRFVGGLLSKRDPIRIRLGSATIGIRGAIVVLRTLPGGGFQLIFLYGIEASATPDGGAKQNVNQPGRMLESKKGDGSDIVEKSTPPGLISDMLKELEGQPGAPLPVRSISEFVAGLTLLQQELLADPNQSLRRIELDLGLGEEHSFENVRRTLGGLAAGLGGSGG